MRAPSVACRVHAFLVLACACLVLAPARAEAAEFDRSISVSRGTRLDVRLFAGEVEVRGWDRPVVRIRASHFSTDAIAAQMNAGTLTVRARSRTGRPHAIDLVIDAPSWMPLSVRGTYVDVSVAGSRGGITAETVRGDVRVHGAGGRLALKSIEGEVVVEGAQGQAALTAVNNGIRVKGLVGDLVADTVNGDVRLENVDSRSVEVSTDGGDISWTGAMAPGGVYRFGTHGGDIDLTLDPKVDAAVSVRAFEGAFRSTFSVAVPERHAGKPFRFVLGSGGSRLELETFRGTISLRPAAVSPSAAPRLR